MSQIEDVKRQWMAMIDAISDPLALIDDEFQIIRQNGAYTQRALQGESLGITEFKGKRCYEVFAARTSPCPTCPLTQKKDLIQAVTWKSDKIIPERTLEVRIHPVHLPGEKKSYVLHYRDVTDEILFQEELAKENRLAAVGRLASGVAHEINSPLAGILAFSQMAISEMKDGNPHKDDLKEIEEAAQKCKVIVESLLGLGRQPAALQKTNVNILDALSSTLRLANPLLKKHKIKLHSTIPEENFIVLGNQGKLGQVFLNLVTNAIHAMKDTGGDLSVTAALKQGTISITVSDSGPGIKPELLSKIFDPFFTTKPVGEGTGLGLAISHAIIKEHGGEIKASSILGEGATFTVSLPRGN